MEEANPGRRRREHSIPLATVAYHNHGIQQLSSAAAPPTAEKAYTIHDQWWGEGSTLSNDAGAAVGSRVSRRALVKTVGNLNLLTQGADAPMPGWTNIGRLLLKTYALNFCVSHLVVCVEILWFKKLD